jgi:hypothetical protein
VQWLYHVECPIAVAQKIKTLEWRRQAEGKRKIKKLNIENPACQHNQTTDYYAQSSFHTADGTNLISI